MFCLENSMWDILVHFHFSLRSCRKLFLSFFFFFLVFILLHCSHWRLFGCSVCFGLFVYVFIYSNAGSVHLKMCAPTKSTILISQRAARCVCCIRPSLVWQGGGAYKGSEGAVPLVSPGFCQTTALIQDDCGCRAIPDWMGNCFQRAAGPRCSFIIISRLEVVGNTLRCR